MILGYGLAFAPALIVAASLAAVNRRLQVPPGRYCIAFGAGLVLAYVSVGAIIAFLGLNIPLLLPVFLNLMLFLGVVALFSVFYILVGSCRGRHSVSIALLYVTLLSLTVITFLAWGSLPAQAWDSLDLWLREASRFTLSQTVESAGQPYFYDQRHPFTVPSLAALSVWNVVAQDSVGVTMLLWSIAGISMALVVFGYALYWQLDTKLAALLAYAVLATPLLENHYLLFGYADIWLAATIAAAMASYDVGIRSRTKLWQVLGLLLLLTLIAVKNIGAFFFITLLLVIGLIYVLQKRSFRVVALSTLGLGVLLTFNLERGPPKIESVFDVTIAGDHLEVSKEVCSADSLEEKFVLIIEPRDPKDLKPIVSNWVAAKYPGRDFRSFRKRHSSVRASAEGACEFNISLPGYDKKLIRIGQLNDTNHPNWMATLVPGADQYSIFALGLSAQIGDVLVVSAIGRHMTLELNSIAQVGKNMFNAHFVNSSYSLWALLLLLSTFAYCFIGRRWSAHEIFPLVATWTLLGALFIAQIFILDFFVTATPGGDTRYSRFILWLPVAVLLILIPVVARAEIYGDSK